MKKINLLFSILLVSFLFLFSTACKEESNIAAPDNSSISSSEPNWIELPLRSDGMLMKIHSVTGLITVQNGGKITLKQKFEGGPSGEFELFAEIKFGPGLVSEDTEFTMALDDETGSLTFSPEMDFNGIAPLTVKLIGLDLENSNEDDIDFVYFDSDGQIVEVDYKKLTIDVDEGLLAVLQVEVEHFSRFGFSKRTEP